MRIRILIAPVISYDKNCGASEKVGRKRAISCLYMWKGANYVEMNTYHMHSTN